MEGSQPFNTPILSARFASWQSGTITAATKQSMH
jgi:hypothetical protein